MARDQMSRLSFGLNPLNLNNSMKEHGFLDYKATLILIHQHVSETEPDMSLAILGALLGAYLIIEFSMFNHIT